MSRQKNKSYAKYNNLAPKEDTDTKQEEIEIDIRSLEHRKSLLDQNNIVCVYLWGDFCGPCKVIAPNYYKLAKKYYNPGKCRLMKENVELDLTEDYRITGVPAFIFYKNGNIVKNENGKIIDIIGGDFNRVESILNNLLI